MHQKLISSDAKAEPSVVLCCGTFDFVTIHIFSLLLRTRTGNQHVVIITEGSRNSPERSAQRRKIDPIAIIFLNNQEMLYGRTSCVLAINGPEFGSKFFTALSLLLETKKLTTTACHRPKKVQVEKNSHTIVARLGDYVPEHYKDCDTYLQPLRYDFKPQTSKGQKNRC